MYAEVLDCDIVIKSEEVMVVELKLNLNITLINQAIERLKMCDLVYIAISKPLRQSRKEYYKMYNLCKLLKIGLLFVTRDGEVVEQLKPQINTEIKKTKQKKLLKELQGRKANFNVGGVSKVPINTSFKERSIHIAVVLSELGKATSKTLRDEYSVDGDVYSVLYNNYYGWFEKVSRGTYSLSKLGEEILEEPSNHVIVSYYIKELLNIDK